MRDDIDDQPELTAISSFVFQEHEHQWEDVARYVREGCDEPQFLFVLQRMLEPGHPIHGLRFGLKRSRSRSSTKVHNEDIHILIRLLRDRVRADRARQLIASEIRTNGLSDQLLRENLADMFSRVSNGPLGMKFEVDRTGRSAPRSKRKLEIQNFLELHADLFNENTARTIEAASVIFGVPEETAKKYLQWRRGVRRRDEFWSEELERGVAHRMRELGYPDYRPLAEIQEDAT
ncbi:MAG: hypothetical protein RIE24_13770 [Silicimonas sp.]